MNEKYFLLEFHYCDKYSKCANQNSLLEDFKWEFLKNQIRIFQPVSNIAVLLIFNHWSLPEIKIQKVFPILLPPWIEIKNLKLNVTGIKFNGIKLSSAGLKIFFASKYCWKMNNRSKAMYLRFPKRNNLIRLLKKIYKKHGFNISARKTIDMKRKAEANVYSLTGKKTINAYPTKVRTQLLLNLKSLIACFKENSIPQRELSKNL